jgi:hypothetical protein
LTLIIRIKLLLTVILSDNIYLEAYNKLLSCARCATNLFTVSELKSYHVRQSRISGVRVEEIIWLDAVVEKLAVKHQVVPDEVEEVLYNKPL